MQGFEEVVFVWKGESFTVPAEEQLRLIARIEDVLIGRSGRQAISILLDVEGPPYSRLAAAYGAALRYAGARVTDEEVYLWLTADFGNSNATAMRTVQGAILGLLSVLAPSIEIHGPSGDSTEADPEKADPTADSSAPSTPSSSGTDG